MHVLRDVPTCFLRPDLLEMRCAVINLIHLGALGLEIGLLLLESCGSFFWNPVVTSSGSLWLLLLESCVYVTVLGLLEVLGWQVVWHCAARASAYRKSRSLSPHHETRSTLDSPSADLHVRMIGIMHRRLSKELPRFVSPIWHPSAVPGRKQKQGHSRSPRWRKTGPSLGPRDPSLGRPRPR